MEFLQFRERPLRSHADVPFLQFQPNDGTDFVGERMQERVLAEITGIHACEGWQLGPENPSLELRGAHRIEHPVCHLDSEQFSRRMTLIRMIRAGNFIYCLCEMKALRQ